MPIKPGKDESQSDWMHRCVSDMMGDGKREQDQAVAACLTMWRDAKGGKAPPKEFADPGYQADGKKRLALDTADMVRRSLARLATAATNYTDEQRRRISIRIAAAWKDKIDPAGPPALDDAPAMAALRREVMLVARADAPDPEDDESHDDYLDRCVDEMTDDGEMDEDDAEEACNLAWDEWSDRGAGVVMHKSHATPAGNGMQFVLSDASPDRFGDIVETAGWDISAYQKNPIALFGHDKSFIVGVWENLKVTDKDLRGHLRLAPPGTSPRIDEIRRLVEADILRATSVGFRPLEHVPINAKDPWGGTRYTKHELVEVSLVAVPANPNALAIAKGLNISPNTARMIFGEDADVKVVQRDLGTNGAHRGEDADKRRTASNKTGEHADKRGPTGPTGMPGLTGEHAEIQRTAKEKPIMLLSQRIKHAEANALALQDQLDKHLEGIDDANPTEEQMVTTEDLTSKIESATRHLNNLKTIETKNASGAVDAGDARRVTTNGSKLPAEVKLRPKQQLEALDYMFRAVLISAKSRADGVPIEDTRRKIYGDDEATRVACDFVLRAATAPAQTTVAGWAQELVQTIWTQFMDVLLPMSVYPKLSAAGLALSFGNAGRIVIPTRNLTPAVSGSFVAEGAPIPVRQTAFASQTITPKKMAVITSFTREMQDFSIPAIEGLLRQAVLEDTAIALDAVLLGNGAATAIAPAGLRSYQAGLTASTATPGFTAFVADYRALMGSLISLTNGNVRKPTMILNPAQVLDLATMQPPAAAAPLWPLQAQIDAGRVGGAALIQSTTMPAGQVILVDAADFTSAGVEGPRLEISDAATLHFEDTTPQDIVSGPSGTPTPATPVKSMWQTDSLALRLILMLNFIMRRPVVAWMTGTAWGT